MTKKDIYDLGRRVGRRAFLAGKPATPAHDTNYMPALQYVRRETRGTDTKGWNVLRDLSQGWVDGWHEANLEAPVPGWTVKENRAIKHARFEARVRARTALGRVVARGMK